MYDLTGKVALVTGAAGKNGIGRAIAVRLAREGANVAVVDKFVVTPHDEELAKDWQGLKSVVAEIESLGSKALGITCDLTQSEEVDKMVENIINKFGKIDILVNNAGIQIIRTLENLSDEIWEAHLSVNLSGTFYCSRAAARAMIRRGEGGRIINIASTLGKVGSAAGRIAYSASKFGVIGITQCLALELAPHKILVNAVCPGLTATDLASEFYHGEALREGVGVQEAKTRTIERFTERIPLGRAGAPEDTTNMVAFLASEEANFITGQSINVNGGLFVAH